MPTLAISQSNSSYLIKHVLHDYCIWFGSFGLHKICNFLSFIELMNLIVQISYKDLGKTSFQLFSFHLVYFEHFQLISLLFFFFFLKILCVETFKKTRYSSQLFHNHLQRKHPMSVSLLPRTRPKRFSKLCFPEPYNTNFSTTS